MKIADSFPDDFLSFHIPGKFSLFLRQRIPGKFSLFLRQRIPGKFSLFLRQRIPGIQRSPEIFSASFHLSFPKILFQLRSRVPATGTLFFI